MNPTFDWKPHSNSSIAFQKPNTYCMVKALIPLNLPFIGIQTILHAQIFFIVKREITVSFDFYLFIGAVAS